MSKIKIGGILQNNRLARISVMGLPGRQDTAAVLLSAFAQSALNVQFIVQCQDPYQSDHIVFCVDRDDLDKALDAVSRVGAELGAGAVSHDPCVASVGIFGPDFRERPGIAGSFLAALAASGIQFQAVSTSVSTCTVLVAAAKLPDAVAAIQRTFELPLV